MKIKKKHKQQFLSFYFPYYIHVCCNFPKFSIFYNILFDNGAKTLNSWNELPNLFKPGSLCKINIISHIFLTPYNTRYACLNKV